MSSMNLVFPMMAMVLLTVVTLVVLFRARVRSVREGLAPMSYYAVFHGSQVPDYVAKPTRHFANLFEAPMLFYVGCLMAMVTGVSGAAVLLMAWGYVAARCAHTFIHLRGNRIRHRVRAYAVSWLFLLALWVHVVGVVALRN